MLTKNRLALAVCVASLLTPFSHALSGRMARSGTPADPDRLLSEPEPEPGAVSSSSPSSLPDAPSAGYAFASSHSIRGLGPSTGLQLRTLPFSALAISINMGAAGIGFEFATPLATKINLRAGASFLNYSPSVITEGIPIDGTLKLRTVNASVDVYPYRSSFHLSPGLTMYNGNQAYAVANIAPGSHFQINDTDYISSPSDPVHGFFNVGMGARFAPSFTVGFGNMLKRNSHWSMPVDVGFQYIGQPDFTLNLTGTVCETNDCTRVQDDPQTQKDLATEQASINSDLSLLRFYPIFKIGLGYRFGHNVKMNNWH